VARTHKTSLGVSKKGTISDISIQMTNMGVMLHICYWMITICMIYPHIIGTHRSQYIKIIETLRLL